MPTLQLRPLGIGEILDAAIKIYQLHWRTLLKLVLVVVAPLQVLQTLILASAGSDSFQLGFDTSTSADPDSLTLSGAEIAGQVVVLILSIVTFLLVTAACFKAVGDAYTGGQPDWRASLRMGVRRLASLAWLVLLYGLALIPAFILLILPGIWLAFAWSMSIPVLMLERVKGRRALGRSFRLVRGRWWPTFGGLLVGYLLAGIVGAIAQGVLVGVPAAAFGDNAAVNAVSFTLAGIAGSLITTPFQAAVTTLLYLDLRVRKEGLDLQLLAQGLGRPEAGGEPDAQPVAPGPDAPAQAAPSAPLIAPAPASEEVRAQAPYWPPPPGWSPPSATPPEPEQEP